jgi:hypothetical protein
MWLAEKQVVEKHYKGSGVLPLCLCLVKRGWDILFLTYRLFFGMIEIDY